MTSPWKPELHDIWIQRQDQKWV